MDVDETKAAPASRDWLIAATFVAIGLVAAILFTLYVLLWDGGAHT
jgi:hypothetical protein